MIKKILEAFNDPATAEAMANDKITGGVELFVLDETFTPQSETGVTKEANPDTYARDAMTQVEVLGGLREVSQTINKHPLDIDYLTLVANN